MQDRVTEDWTLKVLRGVALGMVAGAFALIYAASWLPYV